MKQSISRVNCQKKEREDVENQRVGTHNFPEEGGVRERQHQRFHRKERYGRTFPRSTSITRTGKKRGGPRLQAAQRESAL